jgi:hypothetical protein
MRHLVGLTSGQMLANGRQVAARFQTNLWIWTLPVDKRPVEDLKLLARLMSGNTAKPSEQPSPATAESLHAIWQQLRTKYPSSFSTTAQEIVAWHEFEAQKCEANQQWSAAVFHLKYVAELRPDFPNVAARLTRANEMQKRENY